jgi:hypothetical protein
MNSWFARFRISAALDSGKSLSRRLRHQIAGSEELGRFEQTAATIDRALRQTPPHSGTPPWLHDSIMGAVRAAERPAPARTFNWHWLAGPAAAALAFIAVWVWINRPAAQSDPPLAVVTAALEMSNEMTQQAPAVMMTPLAQELEGLKLDLDNTTQFLLSSLPTTQTP